MVRDLWGHHAEGGTDARPWLDHGHWPSAAPMAARPAPSDGAAEPPGFLPVAAPGLHSGPARPDPRRHRGRRPSAPRLPGRAGAGAEARLGYTHKGMPALMRGKSPRAAARFAARLAGEATVAHAAAFARAAEAALETPAPPRAAALRDGMQALERTANHLAALGAVAEAAGAASLAGRCDRERELLLRAAAAAFGHRLMMDLVVPGRCQCRHRSGRGRGDCGCGCRAAAGDRRSLTRLFEAAARFADRTGRHRRGRPGGRRRLRAPPSAGGRCRGTGPRAAAALDASARALGETLAVLPDGPLSAALPVGSGEGLGAAEGVSGTVWHWLRLDGGLIAACFPLDPGWRAWPVLRAALAGAELAEVAADRALRSAPACRGSICDLLARPAAPPGTRADARAAGRGRQALLARLEAAAQARLGRSLASATSMPEAAAAASWSCAPRPVRSTIWRGSACASSPARATPTCCCSPARSPATCARRWNGPGRRRRTRNGWSRSATARSMAACSRAATPCSAAPTLLPVDLAIRGCPPTPGANPGGPGALLEANGG